MEWQESTQQEFAQKIKKSKTSNTIRTGATKVESESRKLRWFTSVLQIALPVIIALVAHFPALMSGFVWDDFAFVNYWLLHLTFDNFLLPPQDINAWPSTYYRPLGVLTLLVDHSLFGHAALGYHVTNLLIHLCVVVQVWLLTRYVLTRNGLPAWSATVTAAIFAAHPVHVQSVNWISARFDPLATIFVLAAVFLFSRYLDERKQSCLIGIAICSLAALFSKEIGIVVVPLLLVVATCRRDGETTDESKRKDLRKATARAVIACVAATSIYAAMRLSAGFTTGQSTSDDYFSMTRLVRATGFYILQGVYPRQQTVFPNWDMMPSTASSVVTIGVVVAAFALGIRRFREGGAFLVFGITWFFFTLAPSMLVLIRNLDPNPVTERYLYLPSVGLCLVLGGLFAMAARIQNAKIPVMASVAGIIVLWSIQCFQHGLYWTSNLALWQHAAQTTPHNSLVWVNLAEESARRGNVPQQIRAAQRARDLSPDDPAIRVQLARALRLGEKYELANRESEAALAIAPHMPLALEEHGISHFYLGNTEAALACFGRLMQFDPIVAHINIAKVYEQTDPEQAVFHLREALSFDPSNAMARSQLLHIQRLIDSSNDRGR